MALSYVAAALVYIRLPFGGSVSTVLDARWPYFLVLVYLPVLYFALTRRRTPTTAREAGAPPRPTM
jgi:hypothetical protein